MWLLPRVMVGAMAPHWKRGVSVTRMRGVPLIGLTRRTSVSGRK